PDRPPELVPSGLPHFLENRSQHSRIPSWHRTKTVLSAPSLSSCCRCCSKGRSYSVPDWSATAENQHSLRPVPLDLWSCGETHRPPARWSSIPSSTGWGACAQT